MTNENEWKPKKNVDLSQNDTNNTEIQLLDNRI